FDAEDAFEPRDGGEIPYELVLVPGAQVEKHALGVEQVEEIRASRRVGAQGRGERRLGLWHECVLEQVEAAFLLAKARYEVADLRSERRFDFFTAGGDLRLLQACLFEPGLQPATLKGDFYHDTGHETVEPVGRHAPKTGLGVFEHDPEVR